MLFTLIDCVFFFFNDTATTEIYTLSLHDALPICDRAGDGRRDAGAGERVGVDQRLDVGRARGARAGHGVARPRADREAVLDAVDRKSTRLNSSHANISYAVFCLKKKKKSILNLTN